MTLKQTLTVGSILMCVLFFVGGSLGGTTGTLMLTTNRTLTEDHTGNIIIGANLIALNCNGHSVRGPMEQAQLNGIGIQLSSIVGVTVANCRVTNFLKGIVLQGSRNNTFLMNEVSNNAEEGFELEGSDVNIFITNRANQNGRDSFDLDVSRGNIFLEENEANENGFNGFELDRSSNNVFVGNIANLNGKIDERSGFSLDNSMENFFRQNTANSNRRNGFRIALSSDNTFIANVATGNVGREPGPVVEPANCRQIGMSVRNQFLENQFSIPAPAPNQCLFRLPGD